MRNPNAHFLAGEGLHNPEPASSDLILASHYSPASLDLSIQRYAQLASALGLGIRFAFCLGSQLLSDLRMLDPSWHSVSVQMAPPQ